MGGGHVPQEAPDGRCAEGAVLAVQLARVDVVIAGNVLEEVLLFVEHLLAEVTFHL